MKNAYEINILFYYYIIRFSIIMSNVQVVGNPAETAAALARVTGDYRDNIEMNSGIDQLNTDSNGLKDYNHQLQQHLKSEYYNLLDQNALMDFTKTEKARLTDKIKNLKTNKTEELKLDGLFIAIGHDPATSLFKDQLKMDNEGYLITKPDSTETNIPGVYAAGDVKDKTFRQAVTAAGMGCMAALEAEKFLSH